MNAVVYHSPFGKVTGALLDALDAFAALWQAGVEVTFVCIGMKRTDVLTLLNGRYAHASVLLPHLRLVASRCLLPLMRFHRVLAPYSAYKRVQPFLRCEEILVLPTQVMRYDFEKECLKIDARAIFLLDPAQHAYEVPRQIEYSKKIFLEGLIRPEQSEQNVLINAVPEHKSHSGDAIAAALEQCQPYAQALVLSYRKPEMKNDVVMLRPPVTRFFERFDAYCYLPAIGGYDENPRLLIESVWLGKRIVIAGELGADDPVRRKLERLQEDPGQFNLGKNDKLIELMRGN